MVTRAKHREGVGLLRIIEYPHPTLRHPSKPLKRVDAELATIIREMFQLMYASRGIGLAANQVDLPYRLFVVNLTGDPEQPDQEQVFINPVISSRKGSAEDEEGCLSLPGLYGQVKRPEKVTLNAFTLQGEEVTAELSGMFARVVQHEVDHLDGVLFIDKLGPTGGLAAKEALEEFELQFAHQRQRGEIPDDATIAARLAALEKLRC
jgi:peptide deformylase